MKTIAVLLLLASVAFGQTKENRNMQYTGANQHNGAETFNGSETHTGAATHTGAETFTGNAFFAKGVKCDVDALGGNKAAVLLCMAAYPTGAEIDFSPKHYTDMCDITVSGPYHFHGSGGNGWGSAGTILGCATLAAVNSFLVQSSGGSSVILHHGPKWSNLMIQDESNASAGGAMTGAISVKCTNRGSVEGVSFNNFSNTLGFNVKLDGSTCTALDSSYWKFSHIFMRNCGNGIVQFDTNGSGTTIGDGSEIACSQYGLDFQYASAPTNTTYVSPGTSIELPNSAVGIRVATSQGHFYPRVEAGVGTTNTTGVILLSGASANHVGGSYNKATIGVDDQAGSKNNEINVSDVTNVGVPFSGQGDGNSYFWAGREFVLNALNGAIRTAVGQRILRDASGNQTAVYILGSGTTRLVNSDRMQPIASMVRSSNAVTVTTTRAHGFSGSQVVVVDDAPDATFNGRFTLLTASGTTLTWNQTAADATTGAGGIVAQVCGGMLSSRGSNEFLFGAGTTGAGTSTQTTCDTSPGLFSIVSGTMTYWADTGKTIGNAWTPTSRFSVDPTGNVTIPSVKSTTGTRFVCADTAGKLVSQTSACSGT